jgi:hypothetical protein
MQQFIFRWLLLDVLNAPDTIVRDSFLLLLALAGIVALVVLFIIKVKKKK